MTISEHSIFHFYCSYPQKGRGNYFKDFCFISLISSLYKLIYKVLSRRLSQVLHLIIAKSQMPL